MKMNHYMPLLLLGSVLVLAGCETTYSNEGRPIPGTVQSTDSKNSMNNTPRVNPTPNPEPESNPPGPDSDRRVIISQ